MTEILDDIKGISTEELRLFIDDIRDARKKGYEKPIRARSAKNPFADLDPEVAKKILEELLEKALKAGGKS